MARVQRFGKAPWPRASTAAHDQRRTPSEPTSRSGGGSLEAWLCRITPRKKVVYPNKLFMHNFVLHYISFCLIIISTKWHYFFIRIASRGEPGRDGAPDSRTLREKFGLIYGFPGTRQLPADSPETPRKPPDRRYFKKPHVRLHPRGKEPQVGFGSPHGDFPRAFQTTLDLAMNRPRNLPPQGRLRRNRYAQNWTP